MTEAVQTVESAPTDATSGHAEYMSLKNQASEATDSPQPETVEESAPASEPEQETQETKGKDLTDEDKADRKRRNDERRERRWYEERGEMRAQMKVLESQLAELRTNREKQGGEAPVSTDGEPTIDTFLNSGKFKTYEEAQQAWMRAYSAYTRDQIRHESQAQSAEQEKGTIRTNFNKNIKAFEKTHPDFQDALDAVQEAFEGSNGAPTALTTYIVKVAAKGREGVELIDHLGTHPEVLESLADLSHEEAIAELGAIRASLKAQASKPPEAKEPPNAPRSPKSVRASGSVPDHFTAMKKAADSNDFTAFRKASQAAKGK